MSRAHNVVNKLQGLIDKSNNCTKKHDTDLHGAIDSLIEGFGKGEGGGGIIDVETLPTENIDENAVYRTTEEVNTSPEVYLYMGAAYTVAEYFALQGTTATVPIMQVAELPETMQPVDMATTTLPLYVLESDGKAYLSTDGTSASAITFGTMMGNPAMDKGWANDITSVTENGIYCVRGASYNIYHYWTYQDNAWAKFMPILDVTELPTENIDTNTCYHLVNESTDQYFIYRNNDWVEWQESEKAVLEFTTGERNGHIEIPEGVTYIVPYAYYGGQYESVTLPSTIESIGEGAFQNCPNLKTIICNASSDIIGTWATSPETWLDPYCVIKFTDAVIGREGITYAMSDDRTSYYVYSDNDTTSANIYIASEIEGLPVTSIRENAFYENINIENVVIPDSVTLIDKYAFYKCSRLKNVAIGNGVTNIGQWAFGISGLETLTIPNSVTLIQADAFRSCSRLMSATIGSGVTSISDNAFDSCEKLIEVCNLSSLNITTGSSLNGEVGCYASNVYTATRGESKLSTTDDGLVFYAEDTQRRLIGYVGEETDIIIPENCEAIYKWAFKTQHNLESVTIVPTGVSSIGSEAFRDCYDLKRVSIYSGITGIGTDTFFGASNLTRIVIPDTVTNIGTQALRACSSLVDITYLGTMEQWNAITFGSYWNTNTGEYTIHCTDGDIAKS